tara:strand:+ start:163 stop:417 length:255 start_codon:yes stop_codon:yes gene_type:complete
MAEINRSWERLSNEESKKAKEDLIIFFEKERDEKIGIIGAEQILNHFLKSAGSKIYNKGVYDAKKAFESRYKELQFDLDDLIDF